GDPHLALPRLRSRRRPGIRAARAGVPALPRRDENGARRVTAPAPPLPGNVGITQLRVYDWAGPDGLVGGSPHFHFACSEAYVPTGGRGSVQTLSAEGFAEHQLEPGVLVWFTPGVIHRLINDDHLEILVVMQNSGLPEAGDAVLTFPSEVLADPDAYAEHVS